jgi:ankyrin repeat protein
MIKLKILFILSALLSGIAFAQKPNIFHDRDFWKTNPSIEIIEQKITIGNDVAALNKNAFDGVVYAILEGADTNTIKYLLSKEGNNVHKKTHDGRTYIFWAAYKNNLELIKHLVSKDAKTNLTDSHGYTVLNFAASAGQTNIKMYDYLIKMTANIKTDKNHKGANALLLVAPYLENYSLINYLLTKGASLNDKDTDGNGLFEYAAKGGNIPFLKTLIKRGIDKGENAMIFASQGLRRKKNTLETYKFLENVGIKPNVVNKAGKNPLHAIAYNSKNLETYSYFLSKGVDINSQDLEGNSPFINATNTNTLGVVAFLYKTVEDINLKDANGRSALAKAVQKNTLNVVAFLLEKEANIHTVDAKGNSLSYYLIQTFNANKTSNFEEKLTILQKNGLVMNRKQSNGNTLLHIATEQGNLALLKRLSYFDIDVNKQNEEGISALQIAAMTSKNTNILTYLISLGANKNIKTAFGETIYDLASENELFKNNNFNINFLK